MNKPTSGNRLKAASACAAVIVLCLAGWWFTRDVGPDFGPKPDFKSIEQTSQLKAEFFDYLRPMVNYHNQRILARRARLESLATVLGGGGELSASQLRWLESMAGRYEIDLGEISTGDLVSTLLRRVDVIPVELALVQAAKESGWGRSRFAVQANNLFGQWCYTPGCGIVPARRGPDATHEVQRFDSVSEAIRRYMNNLNTHPVYRPLRLIREQRRAQGKPVTGEALAPGLVNYSERRQAYVDEVMAMLRQYHRFESQRNASG